MAYSILKTAQARSQVVGQCKLIWVDATTLKLIPFNGNLIKIGGQLYQIPDAGITLTNAGFAASTMYYIYVWNNNGTLQLTGNQAGHVTSQVAGNNGTEVMSGAGNDGYTLVGMVNTGTDIKFYDTTYLRWVRSWFNESGVSAHQYSSQVISTTSLSPIELEAGIRVYVLLWAGEQWYHHVSASMQTNAVGAVNYLQGGAPPSGPYGLTAYAHTDNISYAKSAGTSYSDKVSTDRAVMFSLYGYVGNATGTWTYKSQSIVTVRR